uniref:Uncharacterized protein n=1 Tax=Micrurus spixii TaxID=129469 RepID=A0A2D4M3W7_9SAUR
MKFNQYVEKLLQNKLILNLIVTIILTVIEEITEHEFTCAPPPFNQIYFGIFFFVPAGIFFFLNFIIQGYFLKSFNFNKDNWCCIIWQSSFPPWMWFVIVLLDGRYLQCAMSTNHNASTKPTNVEMSAISKICGLFLLCGITIAVLISCHVKKSQNSEGGGTDVTTTRTAVPGAPG